MASPDTPGGAASSTAPDGQSSSLAQMGKELLTQLIPLVVSAGGLAALVFAVGAAVSVARFQAAGLPWEQAVNAATESDMRTIGLMWLVVFGLLGLLAVALAYIASPQGRATAAMYYALIAITTVEVGLVWYAARRGTSLDVERMDDRDWWAGGVLLGAAAAATLVVFAVHAGSRGRKTKARAEAARETKRRRAAFLADVARACGCDPPEPEKDPPEERRKSPGQRWFWPLVIVWISACAASTAAVTSALNWYEAVLVGIGLVILLAAARLNWKLHGSHELGAEAMQSEEKKRDPALALPHLAFLILAMLSVVAGVVSALLLGKLWVAPAVIFAGVLGLLTIRVAELCTGFRWYGVSVFFAVCLFGAVIGVLRMLDEPRLQPVAFLMTDGAGVRGVQGVYVGESDDRLWFASIALEDCEDDVVRRGSGRLRSVPLSQVSHVSIGPQMGLPSLAFEAKAMLDDVLAEHPDDELETKLFAVRGAVVLNTLGRQRGEAGTWVSLEDESGADEGLGQHPSFKLDGKYLPLRRLEDGEWQVRLPRSADSGPIYAECGEQTNKSFLTVRKRPYAVLTARPRGDSRWRLNAGASAGRTGAADGRHDPIRWYRWEAGGRSLGWGKNITFEVSRERERRVTLAIGDSEGLDAVISVRLRGRFVRAYPADALFCISCRRLSAEGRHRIRALGDRVAEARSVVIHVHSDERGNETRNDALSSARAHALERQLRQNLDRPTPVKGKGRGEKRPLVTNAHRQNRRVVVVIPRTPTPDTTQAR